MFEAIFEGEGKMTGTAGDNVGNLESQARLTKMGQPRKYSEPTKHVSFSLPVSAVENLKILSALKRTNQTQLILSLINAELEKEADIIAEYKVLLDRRKF